MLKKTFLFALAAMFVVVGAGMASAVNIVNTGVGTAIDGMVAGDGVSLGYNILPTNMHVNPGGQGDLLLYGYFNVVDDGLNMLRVVNTSDVTAVKARVRFVEGKLTQEILDFVICLSAADEWTAFITNANGTGALVTTDTDTPTAPAISTDFDNPTLFRYEGGLGLDGVHQEDTLEGHVDIIGAAATADPSHLGWLASECDSALTIGVSPYFDAPNSLVGDMVILPGTLDTAMGYNATAVANCDALLDAAAGADQPRLTDCTPVVSAVGLDELEYALTKSNLYFMHNNLFASTEAVIAFPTKQRRHQVDAAAFPPVGIATGAKFDSDLPVGSLCDVEFDGYNDADIIGGFDQLAGMDDVAEQIVSYSIWDDAENEFTAAGCDFSPCPPASVEVICYDANVIKVGDSDILATNLEVPGGFPVPAGWEYGWVRIDLTIESNHRTVLTNGVNTWTALGLPAIGYVMQDLIDGTLHIDTTTPIIYDVNNSQI